MNRQIIHGLWIFLMFMLCSCEYELSETNYVDIEKPVDQGYNIQIKAPVNEKGEYVIKYALVKFDFKLPENVYDVRFELYYENDRYNYSSYYVNKDNPSLYLRWEGSGKYRLVGYIPSSRSNTGSLADLYGYEHTGKVLEWKIDLQNNPAPSVNLRYERIDDITFKLIWDHLDPDYGTVDYYSIYDDWYYGQVGATQETFYNVTVPQGYNREYAIDTYFKENYLYSLRSNSVYIENYNY